MISNALIGVSFIVLATTLLDFVLSEKQKLDFSDWLAKTWYSIDEQKAKRLRTARRQIRRMQHWMLGTIALGIAILFLLEILDLVITPSLLVAGWMAELATYKLVVLGIIVAALVLPLLLIGARVVGVYFGYWLVGGSEFVVRRLAEQPKGPIIAVSVISAALIVVLKSLT